MSRQAADRKKVELFSADKTITVVECGTIFILNSGSSAGGAYTASLPPIRAAGPGWWCKFVIGETTGGDVLISASAGDPTSMFVHKPMSRNDSIYGWGNIDPPHIAAPGETPPGGHYPIWAYRELGKLAYGPGQGAFAAPWGNLPFVTPNIESAGSVRFTISSSGPNGCAQENHATHPATGYNTMQPSSSCKINDTLELVTDGVRWYGTVQLHSSVALLDGVANPCTVLSASLTTDAAYYY